MAKQPQSLFIFFIVIICYCVLCVESIGQFHYGAAFGDPYDTNTACQAINEVDPELLMNWGPNNRYNNTIDVCSNSYIKFTPTLWGQTWDDPELSALPNDQTPWGILLENEPNWYGPSGGPGHGVGCNLTAAVCAQRYASHIKIVNSKWGVGVVKMFSPSPVYHDYDPSLGNQTQWLHEYFTLCNCYNDIWTLNHHDYACNVQQVQQNIATLQASFPGKNIFIGELGCNGPTVQDQAQFLLDFTEWAYGQPTITGYFWAGINNVGCANCELVVNNQLTQLGQAFKTIQATYPPRYWYGNTFQISSLTAGPKMVLDVAGQGTGDGTLVDLWQNLNFNNQIWYFTYTGSGFYQISDVNSKKCLDVTGRNSVNGAQLMISTCGSIASQMWRVSQVDNTYVKITNKIGRVMDDAGCRNSNGNPVDIWDDLNNDCQKWLLTAA